SLIEFTGAKNSVSGLAKVGSRHSGPTGVPVTLTSGTAVGAYRQVPAEHPGFTIVGAGSVRPLAPILIVTTPGAGTAQASTPAACNDVHCTFVSSDVEKVHPGSLQKRLTWIDAPGVSVAGTGSTPFPVPGVRWLWLCTNTSMTRSLPLKWRKARSDDDVASGDRSR